MDWRETSRMGRFDMPTLQKSLRLSEDLVREIDEIAKEGKKDFTAVTNELLEEAIKAHRCPGIIFSEGVNGRRARVAGAGIEVWEVIAAYKSVGKTFKRLQKSFHWLLEQQIKDALGYYSLYPEEIDALIQENEQWTPERVAQKYPFLSAGKS
jgi:uncharacterized protein (DUF433 family)